MADIIFLLQKECNLKIPVTEENWTEFPRTPVDIRRSMVVKDGLREARKPRFDPTKLLKVSISQYVSVVISYIFVTQFKVSKMFL